MTQLLAIQSDVQDLLFREARTANAFTDQPVSDEQMAAIYDLVKFGPTAMNSQPLRIVLVRSDDARAKLLKHMSGNNRDKTESAPLVAILAADTEFHETLPEVFPIFPGAKDLFAETPLASTRPASTPGSRSATSSWGCARPVWPPVR